MSAQVSMLLLVSGVGGAVGDGGAQGADNCSRKRIPRQPTGAVRKSGERGFGWCVVFVKTGAVTLLLSICENTSGSLHVDVLFL
jgi:hypothetical protein